MYNIIFLKSYKTTQQFDFKLLFTSFFFDFMTFKHLTYLSVKKTITLKFNFAK